jgi:hypothetical protein
MIKHNGTLYCVTHIKNMRLHITRYMCGQPLMVSNLKIGLIKGFPKKLLFLKEYIDSGETLKIKFALTLLNISRAIVPKRNEVIPLDLSSISDKHQGKGFIIPRNFVKEFVKVFNLSSDKPEFSNKDFYISMKAGPNGPTTLSI